ADELAEHLLVPVIDRLQALEHVLVRPPQVEHRLRVVGQELLRAIRRLLVHLQQFPIDHLTLIDPVRQFDQRSHADFLSSKPPERGRTDSGTTPTHAPAAHNPIYRTPPKPPMNFAPTPAPLPCAESFPSSPSTGTPGDGREGDLEANSCSAWRAK